jgi:hypothetical protein
MSERFKMTEDHLKLLKRMSFRWEDDCYDGSPAVDCKRPYGNSDVWLDVAEITGIVPTEDDDGEKHYPKGSREKCMALHREAGTALEIVMQFQSFELGEFARNNPWGSWRRVQTEE